MILTDNIVKAAHAGDASAQYELARYYGLAGLMLKSQRWLEKACAQNHPASLQLMGRLCAGDIEMDGNYQHALSYFELAIKAGNTSAQMDKASLLSKRACSSGDWRDVVQALVLAGEGGLAAAWTQLALMVDETQQNDFLTRAAVAGDSLAVRLLLANALAEGNLLVAKHWLAQSNGNLPRSQMRALQALMEGNDDVAGVSMQPQTASDDFVCLPEQIRLATLERRSTIGLSEQISLFPKAVSGACCEYLICVSEALQRESMILDPHTGHSRRDHVRTNQSASLGPDLHDAAILYWRYQLASLAGLKERNGEWISVLRYRAGDEYKLHYDFLTPTHPDFSRGGHRRDTVLIYLNDEFSGGETVFPRVSVTVTPKQGSILHFCSMDEKGSLDKNSLHAGLPVGEGEKWVATLWLRQKEFY